MVDRTWIGVFPTDYGKASSWTPSGLPSPGDTAIINGKTVEMTKLFQPGLTLELNAGSFATDVAELDTADNDISVNGRIVLSATTYGAVSLQASGVMSNDGLILFQQNTSSAGVPTGLPRAICDLKRARQLWRFSRLRQRKYLNNIVEQVSGDI